ncbi:hypothetical protein [Paracoccus sp. Ld10]|uniref:hypothetical protein n=1 Tax=Paracoccus sp. Ld10 TaxID=649158 RepID=UPI0038696A0B
MLGLNVVANQRIFDLHRDGSRHASFRSDGQAFIASRAGMSDSDLAGPHQIIKRLSDPLDRGDAIPDMYSGEINILGAQPPQQASSAR